MEIAWTVVPFLIVIGMALPATKVLVAQKDTTNADLTIKITGYQWKWGYDYIKGEGEGIGFISTLDTTQRAMSNSGWRRWVFATNHKDIGTLYLLFSFVMLMIGGVLALLIRAELFQPGLQIVNPELFNQFTTMHGLIMVFGAIMPAFVGFANWMLPLQIGASDMAFARMNNFSFWLMIPAAIMLVASFFMPGGAPAAGWTLYAPLTLQMGPSMDAGIFAMHILGASSIMGSINTIVTILNMRAPGMTLMKMPMFAWTWLITAYLLIAVMPVLAGAITMTLTDRHFGTSFFNPAGGGDPVMYQHIFWFFGHPEVYILVIPGFGVASTLIPYYTRKPISSKMHMVYAMHSIACMSFVVWGHHMYLVGIDSKARTLFMTITIMIALPSTIKICGWLVSLTNGLTFPTLELWLAVVFVSVFFVGGMSGLMVAGAGLDILLHDTYYVVGHFHVMLSGAMILSVIGWIYFNFREFFGVGYFWLFSGMHLGWHLVGHLTCFVPMLWLGYAGMPRRIQDYPQGYTG